MLVLTATGVQSEAHLPFAGLQGQKAPDQAVNDLTQKLDDIAAQGGQGRLGRPAPHVLVR